ncbi:MAG TPA: ABC transporter substrate-binding protein [Syntrophomonadaceae bacterium]|nr:ABC transporter substrate-binding protein [Syntrophomonadaceae bacterium]
MHNRSKRAALVLSVLALVIITGALVYRHNLAVYTASLDTRMFNAGVVGPVKATEPAPALSDAEKLIASIIYEGLVRYDEKSGEIKPLLAKSWSYSKDGRILTINLKKNLKFSNGKKVTAQAVKDAWENNFSTAADWYNISLFLSITGAKERVDGKSTEISGIHVVNTQTLKIELVKPNAVFIHMLVNPIFDVVETSEKDKPVGTGPFVLKDKKEGNLVLVRNEQYHRGLPRLSALNINVYENAEAAYKDYQAGKLDYLDAVPFSAISSIKKSTEYKKLFINRPLLETYSLGFNNSREPYSQSYLLRRALNYAIDRQKIIDNVFGGAYLPLKGVVPSGIPGYDAHLRGYAYNKEKALQLLDEAGYPNGQGLPILTLSYNSDPGHKEVAEAVAAQLGDLGIQVQTLAMDWTYYQKQLAAMSMSFFRIGWEADYPDADSFLYSLQHSTLIGLSNYCGYQNSQVDKLLDRSRRQFSNQEERYQALIQAEQIIIDDAPSLWLFQKQTAKLVSKQVNALEINPLNQIEWYKVELKKPGLEEKT